jgi:hypothetical protein
VEGRRAQPEDEAGAPHETGEQEREDANGHAQHTDLQSKGSTDTPFSHRVAGASMQTAYPAMT